VEYFDDSCGDVFNLIQQKSIDFMIGGMNARNAFNSVGVQTPAESS
jgi:hypothetical protein